MRCDAMQHEAIECCNRMNSSLNQMCQHIFHILCGVIDVNERVGGAYAAIHVCIHHYFGICPSLAYDIVCNVAISVHESNFFSTPSALYTLDSHNLLNMNTFLHGHFGVRFDRNFQMNNEKKIEIPEYEIIDLSQKS